MSLSVLRSNLCFRDVPLPPHKQGLIKGGDIFRQFLRVSSYVLLQSFSLYGSLVFSNYLCCNSNCVANHSGSKKPAQSVKVVIIMDDATAGSIPTRFRIKGMDAPVSPATTRFPVIARKSTKPS